MEILIEIEETYLTYTKKIVHYSDIISEQLRNNKVNEALSNIKDFSDGISWITEVHYKLAKLGYLENQKNKITMINFLKEINLGLDNEDYYLVADIFEYEVKEFFEKENSLNIIKD